MTFDPDATQRIKAAVKRRIVANPAARWHDLSSRLARWGVYVQGALALVPREDMPPRLEAYVAVAFFVLIGAAKLVAEERNGTQHENQSQGS